jgi:TolB protein
MGSRKRDLLCAITMIAVLMIAAVPASATFPGKNGRIAFIQDAEVFTMKPDGSDIKQLTHVGPDTSANWPAWSPDGKQLVFNESPPPGSWVMNADGSNQHLLLAESDYSENRPSFAPDGSKVVFARCQLFVGDGDTCAVYTIGVDGTGLKAITEFHRETTARNPMYSPDGTTIAFSLSNDAAAGFLG